MFKMWQETTRYTVQYNSLHKRKIFLIIKIKAILPLIEPINKKQSLYIDALNRKNPARINKEISDKNEVTKMPDIKYIISQNKYISSI